MKVAPESESGSLDLRAWGRFNDQILRRSRRSSQLSQAYAALALYWERDGAIGFYTADDLGFLRNAYAHEERYQDQVPSPRDLWDPAWSFGELLGRLEGGDKKNMQQI